MKKTKYLLISFLLIVFITPSISFASWWNPFTWFESENKIEISIEISTSTPTVIPEIQTKSTWWNPFSWSEKETPRELATSTEKDLLELETAKAEAEAEKYKLEAEKAKLEMEKDYRYIVKGKVYRPIKEIKL